MSRIIARGNIRVDARRAVAELREHLLVDLHLYLLELVRAAAAGNATRIDLTYDADDLSLTFDGEPLPKNALGRLLDHVLDAAITPEARRIRLFALGINAALGLRPASVEVLSSRDARAATRVRWTPELLSSAKLPELESVPAPEGMAPGTTRVTVRRRLGWDVLKKAIIGGAPREVELLAGAAFGLSAALTQAGKPFPLAPRPKTLLRASIELPGVRRAALEIVPARAGPPSIELLEHGVCLIRTKLDFGLMFPSWPFGDIEIPARIIVDADALPTNASRGKLREDAPLGRLIQERAIGAFHDAVLGLAAVVAGWGEVPAGVEVLAEDDPAALEDALGAVLCVVGGAIQSGALLDENIRALLDLPLLRDGHGDPLAISALGTGQDRPIHLWTQAAPIAPELRPWTRNTVWIRGRIVEQLLSGLNATSAEALVERALRSAERRKKLLERAPSGPVLPAQDKALLEAAFHVNGVHLDGLRGEVAILAGTPATRRIHVFVEDRLIETVELDAALIPLPIEAAIGWEGRLRPHPGYDGVEQDEAFRRAVYHAVEVAAREAGERLVGEGPALHPILRAAVGALAVLPARFGLAHIPSPADGACHALRAARIWPTTEPSRLESLNSLAAEVKRSRGLCTADAGASGKAADGRPVLVLTRGEAAWLSATFGCPLVPYGDALIDEPNIEEARRHRSAGILEEALGIPPVDRRGPMLDVVQATLRAKITLGPAPRITICHAGKILCTSALPAAFGGVVIIVDDDTIVPTPAWGGLLTPVAPETIEAIERAFCARVVAAIEGDPRARSELSGPAPTNGATIAPAVRDYLIARSAALPAGSELAARIGLLPFFTVLDAVGVPAKVSLLGLTTMHPPPEPIPMLTEPPGFETLAWHPVLAPTPDLVTSLQRWSGRRAIRGEPELANRRAAAITERERRAFLSGPAQDPRALGDLADPGAIAVFLDRLGPDGIWISIALPRSTIADDGPGLACAWIDVLFHGRALCRRPLPAVPLQVVARVGLVNDDDVVGLRDLSPSGLDRVTDAVHAASRHLACAIVNAASGPAAGAALFHDRRALRLVLALLRMSSLPLAASLAIDELAGMLVNNALRWPTVQGEERPFRELSTDGGRLLAGRQELVPWHLPPSDARADLDRPILLLREGPLGDLLQAIVGALGGEVRDVSDSLEKLQARRSRSAPPEIPRLPGEPAHPALRVGLDALGVDKAEGELEIIGGPASDVRFIDDLASVPQPIPATLPFPMRILARVERADPTHESAKAILRKIAAAAGRHLLSLAPRVDELPGFVRDHLRGAVCKAVAAKRRIGKRAAAARLFPDITGAFHSYSHLTHDPAAELTATTARPPHPVGAFQVPVLCLSEAEIGQLRGALKVRDVTALAGRHLTAERRASAPPLAIIGLSPETRAQCVAVATIAEGSVEGEVGILAPEHKKARGISVHVGKRPVCVIFEGVGWPVVAVVNDDTVATNRFFDDINVDAAGRIRAAVRSVADKALRELLAPPPDALAVRWLDGAELVDAGFILAGSIYLSAAWPREPSVLVRLPGVERAVPRSLVVSEAPPYLFGDVPVSGRLLSSAVGPWHAAATIALRLAAEMVGELVKGGEHHADLPLYQWELRLLGHAEGGSPTAPTGDGGAVRPVEVLAELAARGNLWVSDGQGSPEGAFPAAGEALPSFVLKDGSPLCTVLRHRAVPGVLRELAAAPDEPIPISIEAPAPLPAAAIEIKDRPADAQRPAPWGGELWHALRALFRREEPAVIETPLTRALHEAFAELALKGFRVREVVETNAGPALRFEEARGRLVMNRRHRALSWIDHEDRRALLFLVAAAASEINRSLVSVTDEEERRALGALLARAAGEKRA